MLNVLSVIFPKYKVKIWKKIDLSGRILFPRVIKKGKSNLNLILMDFYKKEPMFFVKLYITKFLTLNRVKKIIKTFEKLEKREVFFIKPFLAFYISPYKAYFKKQHIYGGIIYPFVEKNFLSKERIFEFKKYGMYEKFLDDFIKNFFYLHEKGVYLKDTKYNNFWYDQEKGLIKIFDLDGIKILNKPLSKKMRLKDLATFVMSLEWIFKNNKEGEKIFFKYSDFYPYLEKRDIPLFRSYIKKRHTKRVKSLFKKKG